MTEEVGGSDAWLVLFRVGFAGAACWHLLGNAAISEPSGAIAVGVTAAAVAWWPRSVLAFAALTAAIGLSIWQEAPILGNHWLLAGFVGLAATLAGAAGSRAEGVLGAARATVLVFYAFAAFAKLNAGFFDPAVSCGTFYLSESARSLGWDLEPPTGALGTVVVWATAGIELAVPILLLRRATRAWGVLLAVAFHVAVAVDHRHQFYDFTSLLVPVFSTFLPGAAALSLLAAIRDRIRPHVVRGTAAGLAVAAGLVTAGDEHDLAFELGYASWQLVAAATLPAIVVAVVRWRHAARGAGGGVLRIPALVVPVVALAVLNGISPYVELKTATAWNMYANLRMVDGDSNHFVVRASLPLASTHDDLVEVVEGDGPLAPYAFDGLLLPRRQLRWFLQEHPELGAVLRIDGRRVTVEPGAIPAELGPPVPEVVGRLLVARAVVGDGEPVGCQASYLPAT